MEFVDNLSVKRQHNTVVIKVYTDQRGLTQTIERRYVRSPEEILPMIEALITANHYLESSPVHLDVYFNEGIDSAEFWYRVFFREGKVVVNERQHYVSDLLFFAEQEEKIRVRESAEFEYDDEGDGREYEEYEFAYGFDE